MALLIIAALGLVLGSFVNALVWRVHEQANAKRPDKDLSILHGRSMCPHCRHTLGPKDLVPVVSWLLLRGRCQYCHKTVSVQYPLVELGTSLALVFSYAFWPEALTGQQLLLFCCWVAFVTGFMALIVYDIRWMVLPDRIVYPLIGLAVGQWLAVWLAYGLSWGSVANIGLAALAGGGIFYILFQLSGGKWIGGGDVKLGFLLGLVVGQPVQAFLLLFIASLLGSFVSIPLLISRKASRKMRIPFGPFLLAGGFIVVLFGSQLIDWYDRFYS